jgi:hypothetical protein
MKKFGLVTLLIVAAAMFVASAFAQASMSPWAFFVEVTPGSGAPGRYKLAVPLGVMNDAREDLADLRLYDAGGREVPYALRIRKDVDEKQEMGTRLFNQANVGTASEVSVDLRENPGEHNEVEIETEGRNFRRRVDLEGSDFGKDWRTLKTGDVILNFESQTSTVESNRVSYPTSRYRYLRVRVFADELTSKQAPVVSGVKVLMALHEKGELTKWTAAVSPYQLLRNQGAPASSWSIDLGARVPIDRLMIDVDDASFSRPFQVEVVDDTQNIRLVASGELTRRVGEERRPLVVNFEKEESAQKLRLVINDYNNQTLTISSISAGAPARQLVFDLKETASQPLRLFFGNPKASAPHYDFEKELPAKLSTEPMRSEVAAVSNNPDYRPEPLPLTERIPWLIYVVLAASSIALAIILISLARTAIGSQPTETSAQS